MREYIFEFFFFFEEGSILTDPKEPVDATMEHLSTFFASIEPG